MRKFLLILLGVLVLANIVMVCAIGYFVLGIGRSRPTPAPVLVSAQANPSQTPFSIPSTRTAAPTLAPSTSVPPISGVPSNVAPPTSNPSDELATLDELAVQNPPRNDRVQLAQEYRDASVALATPAAPRSYQVGDRETFWVNRDLQSDNQQISATLRYMNDIVYMWVEDGEQMSTDGLRNSAELFAQDIYPLVHSTLGEEARPGVDNDPRLHILNARIAPAVAGYFSSPDTLPATINAQSNEREMFYMNSRAVQPGTEYYNSVLAHEFTHMVHRHQNERGEASWITEGFGDLGMELAGFQAGHEQSFAIDPDLQLNSWDILAGPHYGASYLFMSYQLNRFGADYIRQVFGGDLTGIPSINQALAQFAPDLTFDELFADWVVANYLNDSSEGARFGYVPAGLNIRPTVSYSRYPFQAGDTVHQYGTDYIELEPAGGDVTFNFDGSDTVRLIPTDAQSGSSFYWSGRTDMSNTEMVRRVDLSHVSNPTLKFWTWYSLEDDYDYGYVAVSTDGGKSWDTLPGKTTTNNDPNGYNYMNAFNCKSGVGCGNQEQSAQWIQEEMDLSDYAGREILLRFQQVTDDVYTDPGLAIDSIEIPEIGFADDVETSGDWTLNGFVRTNNTMPQRFIVQAIEFGATPRVVSIPLDANNRGTYTTSGLGTNISRVVLTVSGSTPVTWETADYTYTVH